MIAAALGSVPLTQLMIENNAKLDEKVAPASAFFYRASFTTVSFFSLKETCIVWHWRRSNCSHDSSTKWTLECCKIISITWRINK
jgi:hypothetical protein